MLLARDWKDRKGYFGLKGEWEKKINKSSNRNYEENQKTMEWECDRNRAKTRMVLEILKVEEQNKEPERYVSRSPKKTKL